MTDEQINAAIAEACGWEVQLSFLQSGLEIVRDGKRKPLPNYCTDLNAMHLAEQTIYNHNNLWTAYYYHIGAGPLSLHATARKKAEAFLRALGKWKEATDKESLTVGGATTEESSVDQKEVQK